MPAQDSNKEQIRTELNYRDGTVLLLSDSQSRITQTLYRAEGHVKITFQDTIATGDEAQYDMDTRAGFLTGHVRFSQKDQWLTCSRAEFNFNSQTGVFYDASGYTDRQFSIKGRTILKTGPDTYRLEDSFVTFLPGKTAQMGFPCLQDGPPGRSNGPPAQYRIQDQGRPCFLRSLSRVADGKEGAQQRFYAVSHRDLNH